MRYTDFLDWIRLINDQNGEPKLNKADLEKKRDDLLERRHKARYAGNHKLANELSREYSKVLDQLMEIEKNDNI